MAFSAAVLAWPPLVRAAFGDDGTRCLEDATRDVAAGLERARRRGKPLLVLSVPRDVGERISRGVFFGELLNHGADPALALLATVEVVCAGTAAVACVVPAARELREPPPLFLLIDSAPDATRVTPFDARLVTEADLVGPPPKRWRDQEADEEARARSRIDGLTALLVDALAGPALAGRAERNAASLRAHDRTRIAAVGPDRIDRLPLGLVDRAAPSLLASVWPRRTAPAAERGLSRLADAARRRITDAPPPGARWVHLTGCDEVVEGDTRTGGLMCGMGGVPRLSARFLRFFVDLMPPSA